MHLTLATHASSPVLLMPVTKDKSVAEQLVSLGLPAHSAIPPSFKANAKQVQLLTLDASATPAFALLLGLGASEDACAADKVSTTIRQAAALLAKNALTKGFEQVSFSVEPLLVCGLTAKRVGQLIAEGVLLGTYQFVLRKAPPKEDALPQTLTTFEAVLPEGHHADFQAGFAEGQWLAEATNAARHWVNDSANFVTPTYLAEQAKALSNLGCTVLSMDDCKAKGMGSFASVARGSDEPAYLVHLRYQPENAQKTVVLVGKGITFDSGGLSLKPPKSQETMKLDMAGAAAVLAVMTALNRLQDVGLELPVAVHGIIPTCENMPSAHATRPGDIVTAMNGKTIEITNTDAEGRLILADALLYAQEVAPDPAALIDLATLTAGAVVGYGRKRSAIMANSAGEALREELIQTEATSGEAHWPFPMDDELKAYLKSPVADCKNSGSGGQGGTSFGGLFLEQFVNKKTPWVHMDIGGPAYLDKGQPDAPKGGTGFGVRTLITWLLTQA